MALRLLSSLFDRYVRVHESVTCAPRRLAAAGVVVEVAEALLRDGRAAFSGRAEGADEIALRFAGSEARAHRPADGTTGSFRWHAELPWAQEAPGQPPPFELIIAGAPPVAVAWRSRRLARLALLPGFLARLAVLVPAAIGWLRSHEPRHRSAIRRGLGLDTAPGFGPLDPAGLPGETPATQPDPARGTPASTILVPVHDAFDLLGICLERIRRHSDLPWRIVLVNDASRDPRVAPLLRDWTDRQNAAPGPLCRGAHLIDLTENLGFVGAVNAGLAHVAAQGEGGAVVLVNTDAFVPAGWLSRLVAPLDDPAVASVTPMSNAAEIMTVPVICAPVPLAEGEVDRIDALAGRIPARTAGPQADLPTGVGFCMALSPHFLDRVPLFDTAFGRGYGEEVDWCQKTRMLGGRHVAQAGLFVEHRGHASFGSESSRTAIRAGGQIISRRYLAYDAAVQGFIRRDPLRSARLALGLGWAAGQAGRLAEPLPIYLAHAMGGGAELWLQEAMAADLARGLPSVVLRVGGLTRWQIELVAPGGVTGAATDDFDLVRRCLALLPHRRIVYSCGVGETDPAGLPGRLLALKGHGDRLEVLFHDWFPVTPSFTMLDADGVWRGVPVAGRAMGRAHEARRPDGSRVDLAEWQAEWSRLVGAADRVTVFSPDGLQVLSRVWPGLNEGARRLVPHAPSVLPGIVPEPRPGTAPVIGVLGNINRHKGAGVVAALARQLRGSGIRLVLIGDLDPALARPPGLVVHGPYDRADIAALAGRYGVTRWLVPAVWPETFSYVTHEALATGLPVMAFDLGAQGDAVRAAANGVVLPLSAGRATEAQMAEAVIVAAGGLPATGCRR